jgi:hypothetical protein
MPMRRTIGALVVLAAIACVVLANIVLLGYANPHHDPVGALSPRVEIPPAPRPAEQHFEDD